MTAKTKRTTTQKTYTVFCHCRRLVTAVAKGLSRKAAREECERLNRQSSNYTNYTTDAVAPNDPDDALDADRT